jgi:hypothetical protein
MIVRILGEGQLAVDDAMADELNQLDVKLEAAVNAGDEAALRPILAELLARIRAVGTPVPADTLEPSDVILPYADASIADVRGLLSDEGLIPGRASAQGAFRLTVQTGGCPIVTTDGSGKSEPERSAGRAG